MAVLGRSELAGMIADKAEVSNAQANRMLGMVLDSIVEAMERGDEVRLVGFGTFRIVETRERAGRNPRTGQPMTIPAGRRPTFSAGSRLTEGVRGGRKAA